MVLPLPYQQKILKGSLVVLDPAGQKPKATIPFQYNPTQVKRNLRPMAFGRTADALSPAQSLEMTIQLESIVGGPNPGGQGAGILPSLAVLETLLWPKSLEIKTYLKKLESSKLWAVELSAPQVLLEWGPHRTVPVRVTGLSITEEQFNAELSPVRAEVALSLEVVPLDAKATSEERTHLTSYLSQLESLGKNARHKTGG